MFDWELANPWFLALATLAPLVYWLATRSASLLGYSSLTLLAHTRRSWRQRLSHLPALLLALALLALVVALARPRTPQRETRVTGEGIAIMMVVDLSSSMDARDMVADDQSINRLDAVKEVFRDFVTGTDRTAGRGRANDLIGVVTFAGYADSLCPLTLDHGNLLNMVKDLEIVPRRTQEDGTALGDGLGLAVERLRRSKAKSRVAILLTDGVSNAGVIDPLKAAELANQCDIKVYCIGAGTRGVAPMPVDFFGTTTLVATPVEIDEATLKQIAEKTDGRYFRAVDKDALATIYREIDTLERTEVTEVRFLQYTEHFPHFVGAGLGLLGLAMLLGGSLFRRLP